MKTRARRRALGATLAACAALAPASLAAPLPPPVVASTTVSSHAVYFGDEITATLRLVVDRSRVNPAGVQIDMPQRLYALVGQPQRTLLSAGRSTIVTTVYTFECLRRFCLVGAKSMTIAFPDTTVTYPLPGGATGRLGVTWPDVSVGTRISAADVRAKTLRTGLDTVAPAHLGSSRGTVVGLLSALAGFLGALSAALFWVVRPRRRPAVVVLTPLELALGAAERAAAGSDGQARRTALDALARALDALSERGLATAARRLAWKEEVPSPEAMRSLAAGVDDELRRSA